VLLVQGRVQEREAALPVSRMAPKPMRLTVMSPSVQVPDAAAVIVSEVIAAVWHTIYGYVYVFRVLTAEAGLPRS
jgi:hypothetical protein